jgi:hypothetical protein
MTRLALAIGRRASRLPADLALSLIPSLSRAHLERLVQQLIDRIDEMDGDSDLEAEETDQSGGEDDCSQTFHDGPGCPISDPANDDDREDDRCDWERSDVAPTWSIEA